MWRKGWPPPSLSTPAPPHLFPNAALLCSLPPPHNTISPLRSPRRDVLAQPKCGEWVTNGECVKNEGYMMDNCRKACGKCEKLDKFVPQTDTKELDERLAKMSSQLQPLSDDPDQLGTRDKVRRPRTAHSQRPEEGMALWACWAVQLFVRHGIGAAECAAPEHVVRRAQRCRVPRSRILCRFHLALQIALALPSTSIRRQAWPARCAMPQGACGGAQGVARMHDACLPSARHPPCSLCCARPPPSSPRTSRLMPSSSPSMRR